MTAFCQFYLAVMKVCSLPLFCVHTVKQSSQKSSRTVYIENTLESSLNAQILITHSTCTVHCSRHWSSEVIRTVTSKMSLAGGYVLKAVIHTKK